MALAGHHSLHLLAGKEAAQSCPTSHWKKWLTRQVWLPTWQIIVFDTGNGYKRFDTLRGGVSIRRSWLDVLKASQERDVYYITSNSRILRSGKLVIVKE